MRTITSRLYTIYYQILLLPPSVICSYLPNDTSLNVSVIRPHMRTTNHSVKVESAIGQNNIQKIDLPIFTSDNDYDVHMLLSLRLLHLWCF